MQFNGDNSATKTALNVALFALLCRRKQFMYIAFVNIFYE